MIEVEIGGARLRLDSGDVPVRLERLTPVTFRWERMDETDHTKRFHRKEKFDESSNFSFFWTRELFGAIIKVFEIIKVFAEIIKVFAEIIKVFAEIIKVSKKSSNFWSEIIKLLV